MSELTSRLIFLLVELARLGSFQCAMYLQHYNDLDSRLIAVTLQVKPGAPIPHQLHLRPRDLKGAPVARHWLCLRPIHLHVR